MPRSPNPDAGLRERLLEQGIERLHVGAGGDLGHDAAEALVEMLLRRDQVRANREPVLEDGHRGLVAAGLDAEGQRQGAARHGRTPSGSSGRCASSRSGVRGRADLVGPHDQRVLLELLVVVLAHADRPEPVPAVQPLRAPVRDADLERDRLGAHLDRAQHEVVEQPRRDLVTLMQRIDGNVVTWASSP